MHAVYQYRGALSGEHELQGAPAVRVHPPGAGRLSRGQSFSHHLLCRPIWLKWTVSLERLPDRHSPSPVHFCIYAGHILKNLSSKGSMQNEEHQF